VLSNGTSSLWRFSYTYFKSLYYDVTPLKHIFWCFLLNFHCSFSLFRYPPTVPMFFPWTNVLLSLATHSRLTLILAAADIPTSHGCALRHTKYTGPSLWRAYLWKQKGNIALTAGKRADWRDKAETGKNLPV